MEKKTFYSPMENILVNWMKALTVQTAPAAQSTEQEDKDNG